jgi:dihydropteroate synthase
MRPIFQWSVGSRSLQLGMRTLIMGIVNVTPDSFSDGGKFFDRDSAVEHAETMLQEGADIIDIGGESTRPGARVEGSTPGEKRVVSAEEELKRVIPVIKVLKKKYPARVISVDTYKAEVARAAVYAGVEVVNDVSGFRWDPQMPATIADLKCGAVLMHMRGRPDEWRKLPPLVDATSLVKRELREWSERALAAGMRRDKIVLDPGFGFGKSFDENYPLMAHFEELHGLGFPLLVGTSRKSFIGRALGGEKDVPPEGRLYGAHIVRTHDVKASVEAARLADAVLNASG